MRDFRIYYTRKFENFIRQAEKLKDKKRAKRNLFALLMVMFANEVVDRDIIAHIYQENDPSSKLKQVALAIGSFILPKQLISSFELKP